MTQLKPAMRVRGIVKVLLAALTANEILTAAFTYAARLIDPDIALEVISLFSFTTCALMGAWLQSDARRAYFAARDQGYVHPAEPTDPSWRIAVDCPKRWLVVLHIELDPCLGRLYLVL